MLTLLKTKRLFTSQQQARQLLTSEINFDNNNLIEEIPQSVTNTKTFQR